MKMVSLSVIALCFGGLLIACSSDDSSGSGGSGASACKPANGTYKVKYRKDGAGTGTCADIPETTIEIKDSSGDGGTSQTASGCTSVTNNATCTNTTTCSNTQGGMTVESKTETKFSSGSVSGSMEQKVSGSPGGAADSNCKYTFTWTKQ